ncbi:competence/damage-inducible protein A [Jeotgalibacillus proteolyticus]|uniref:Putative competence-damage inducible protein n=1 Tax=Jeotgalibacillus proteolyticus TaxID=2082395 RepID=A0A2S5GG79_9BACL|nr:competence/damage-inducible protein A [Jeotgalibacillus proteolyticus]PPA71996.1 competence/damage-inducible protein A [Jeotgalibacillus proteolyticus]
MYAEIIAVGSELLLGQIANTNAQFISQQLAELGIDVYRHRVVGDNADRLLQEIQEAEMRSDLVILTGGLGPTKDDLTKETMAAHTNRKLVMHEESLLAISEYFKAANREMTDNNKKQAIVLDNSTVFINRHGMAPGMLLRHNNTVFVLLPGPPREMKPMFQLDAVPELLSIFSDGKPVRSRVLRYFGIGEAELETKIEALIDAQKNPTIAPLASDGEVTLRLSAKHENKETAGSMLDKTEEKINSIVGEFMYGKDDETLLNKAFSLLSSTGKTIASAESLTAGMFSSQIASLPGASAVFKGGIICYTNESKRDLTGVKEETLLKYGAVSEQCAKELAAGVKKSLNSDIGISFTGVAGPDSLENKPAGTICIGIAMDNKPPIAISLSLKGERNYTRIRTVKHGLFQLIRLLEDRKPPLN